MPNKHLIEVDIEHVLQNNQFVKMSIWRSFHLNQPYFKQIKFAEQGPSQIQPNLDGQWFQFADDYDQPSVVQWQFC